MESPRGPHDRVVSRGVSRRNTALSCVPLPNLGMGVKLQRIIVRWERPCCDSMSHVAWPLELGRCGVCEDGSVRLVLSCPIGAATAAVMEDASVSRSPSEWKNNCLHLDISRMY